MSTTPSTIFTGDACFPYDVIVQKSFFDSDPLIAGIVFLVGAIVGGLFGLCCAYFCMKDITRHKDGDKMLYYGASGGKDARLENEKNGFFKSKVAIIESTKVAPTPDAEVKVSMKRKKTGKRRRIGTAKGDDALTPIALLSVGEDEATAAKKETKSLADVLLQSTNAGMEAELSAQDLDSLTALENDLRGENINTMVQMLRVLLQQQMQKGAIGEDDFKNMMKGIQSDIGEVLSTAGREKTEQEADLKKKYENDPDKLDEEMEKLQSKHMSRINTLLGETTEKVRKDIRKNSNLSDEALEALMSELHYNMAESERKLGDERKRQALALEERLAKRRQLSELYKHLKDQQGKEIEVRCDTHNDTLSQLVDSGKMMDRQREDLINAYEDDLRNTYLKNKDQMQRQELHLAEKLRAKREKKLAQLAEKQEQEREDFIKKVDSSTNTDTVRESFHKLIVSQREEKEDLVIVLDEDDAEKFKELFKTSDKDLKEDLQKTDDGFSNALQDRAQLSAHDVDKIMRVHDAQMEEYEKDKKAERKRMQAKMMEKLEKRKQKAEEEIMLAQAEEQNLVDQQTSTVKKFIGRLVDTSEEAKEKILREHEQHMSRVNNQLQMSKLRQEKALEQRLNKRRARVAELKDQKEKLLSETKEGRTKEKANLSEQIEKQIKDEEKQLEDMKKKQVDELRRTLAQETADALSEQEKQLGLLIARLEVGAARRQALIAKQDKTIKELESKIVDKVEEEHGDELKKDRRVDQIIHQHSREVEYLEDKLQNARDRQEQSLQQKLQAKKIKREREMERELEDEVQEELEQQERQGAGLASSILTRTMMDQRHKMAMEQLGKEMQIEMQKQREELNKELEIQIQKELAEQKKSFLAQLATISKMSKEEINEVVENAVNDAGGDETDVKRLSKEIKNEMKRAKSELQEDRSEYSDYRRARTDMYDEEDERDKRLKSRPKSGRRPPRSAFKDDDVYDY